MGGCYYWNLEEREEAMLALVLVLVIGRVKTGNKMEGWFRLKRSVYVLALEEEEEEDEGACRCSVGSRRRN